MESVSRPAAAGGLAVIVAYALGPSTARRLLHEAAAVTTTVSPDESSEREHQDT